MLDRFRIGTAGWTIPKQQAAVFAAEGTHLARYAQQLHAVEINSSFQRPHRPSTYARWAAAVPPEFRFAVKVPREVTHTRRLTDASEPLARFFCEVETLGARLGPLLVQLPPSLRYDRAILERFFSAVRERFSGNVACEPRHPSWFESEAEDLLIRFRVARVAADPAVVPRATEPGGWPGFAYWRFHGSPKVYYSRYESEQIERFARQVEQPVPQPQERWCIFDNTALGEATGNALDLLTRLTPERKQPAT